jgi:transposase
MKRYDEAFKQEAIELALKSEDKICEIAQGLGINEKTLYNWVAEARRTNNSAKNKAKAVELSAEREIRKLEKELERVKEERDILKKAAMYFAQER